MLVCLYVFNTLIELEHVSDIADAEKPIKAFLEKFANIVSFSGNFC